jgi:hypothetical protein
MHIAKRRMRCFLCQCECRFTSGTRGAVPVKDWNVMVCRECLWVNPDGVNAERHPHLLPYLTWLGLEVNLVGDGGLIAWPRL